MLLAKDFTPKRLQACLGKTNQEPPDNDTSFGSLSYWNPDFYNKEYFDMELFNSYDGIGPWETSKNHRNKQSLIQKSRVGTAGAVSSGPKRFYLRKERIVKAASSPLTRSASEAMIQINKSSYLDTTEKLQAPPAINNTKDSLLKMLAGASIELKPKWNPINHSIRPSKSEIKRERSKSTQTQTELSAFTLEPSRESILGPSRESIRKPPRASRIYITPTELVLKIQSLTITGTPIKKNPPKESVSSSNYSPNRFSVARQGRYVPLYNEKSSHTLDGTIITNNLPTRNRRAVATYSEIKTATNSPRRTASGFLNHTTNVNRSLEDLEQEKTQPTQQRSGSLVSEAVRERLVLLKKQTKEKEVKSEFKNLFLKAAVRPLSSNPANRGAVFLWPEPLKLKYLPRPTVQELLASQGKI